MHWQRRHADQCYSNGLLQGLLILHLLHDGCCQPCPYSFAVQACDLLLSLPNPVLVAVLGCSVPFAVLHAAHVTLQKLTV